MEYYIMGSKKNAQKIRNAFAAQGNNVGDLDCSDELCLYFSVNGHIICTHRTVYQRIVMTHQNYQELPL